LSIQRLWRGKHVVYLLQLGLLCLFLFAGFERLPVQRLGCELLSVSLGFVGVDTSQLTFKLKSAFSRPDIMYSWAR